MLIKTNLVTAIDNVSGSIQGGFSTTINNAYVGGQ